MLTLKYNSTVKIFNTLLHGLDVAAIIRMDIQPVEELAGLVQTFIIGWLVGACIAGIYNIFFNKKLKTVSKILNNQNEKKLCITGNELRRLCKQRKECFAKTSRC